MFVALFPEDCRILAQVIDSELEKSGSIDVPPVLNTYNKLRLEDVHAVCALSEEGLGGARSMRLAFAAQLMLITLLNKTLGKLAPKVINSCLPACALFASLPVVVPWGGAWTKYYSYNYPGGKQGKLTYLR